MSFDQEQPMREIDKVFFILPIYLGLDFWILILDQSTSGRILGFLINIHEIWDHMDSSSSYSVDWYGCTSKLLWTDMDETSVWIGMDVPSSYCVEVYGFTFKLLCGLIWMYFKITAWTDIKREPYDWQVCEEGHYELCPPPYYPRLQIDYVFMHLLIIQFPFWAIASLYFVLTKTAHAYWV